MKLRGNKAGRLEGVVVPKKSRVWSEVPDGESSDFTPEELQDFLAADLLETRADNKFKEDLRKKLWHMVDERYGPRPEKV